ncbi:MAG TPA: fasciclin domain-containing protein, partial [Verrucomicrobiae bacterium]
NQSTVIAADIEAVNGVIHVIDEVILPGGGTENGKLSVTAKGNQLTVVWPFVNGQTQVLEAAGSFTPLSWTAIAGLVTTSDGVNKVTLSADGPNRFFRIRSTSP